MSKIAIDTISDYGYFITNEQVGKYQLSFEKEDNQVRILMTLLPKNTKELSAVYDEIRTKFIEKNMTERRIMNVELHSDRVIVTINIDNLDKSIRITEDVLSSISNLWIW